MSGGACKNVRKTDDSTLSPADYTRIRTQARRALKEAGALGRFPTNVADIMSVARVVEVQDDVLGDAGFLTRMRRKAGAALKSALSKVLGLFDAPGGLVFIDRSMQLVKQTFVRLHEAAHAFLPWQRPMYAVVEDCEQSLAPDVADMFDREANVFAAEVLFQLDAFAEEAEGSEFGIFTPVRLSKKYGASIYASIRQYVSKNHRTCAVLVLNPPELIPGDGFRASLRRVVTSPSFAVKFSRCTWQDCFTPDDSIGAMVPIGHRRASGKRQLELVDDNGQRHECVAEAFTQKRQVFILIHVAHALTATPVLVA
jgi:hypothetical protein